MVSLSRHIRAGDAAEPGDTDLWFDRLVGGVAHDFANLLLPIELNAGAIQGEPQVPDRTRDRARLLGEIAGRAAALVNKLLAYTGLDNSAGGIPVHVGGVLKDCSRLLRHVSSQDECFRADLPPQLLWVRAEPATLLRLLLSLSGVSFDLAASLGAAPAVTMSLLPSSPESSWAEIHFQGAVVGEGVDRVGLRRFLTRQASPSRFPLRTGLLTRDLSAVARGLGGKIRVRSGVSPRLILYLPRLQGPG